LDHQLFARIALSFLCAIQGAATIAIDFNRTHATNPFWTGHARFHVVWQSCTVALLSALELLLIGWAGPAHRDAFYGAALLAALSPLGFLMTFACRRLFGGTLSDPNGIPPLRIVRWGCNLSIDMNLAAVISALFCLGILALIYRQ